MQSPVRPLPAQHRRYALPDAAVSSAKNSGAASIHASVESLDAALWHERSTLEALLVALSTGRAGDLEALLRERRLARLLCSVEMAALTAESASLPHSPDLATAIGGGWAGVLNEHDTALERLGERVDAAAASAGRLGQTSTRACSRLERASGEQAG